MEKPVATQELVLHGDGPLLTVHMATSRAVEWIRQEARGYSTHPDNTVALVDVQGPYHTLVLVSECFDAGEVMNYLRDGFYELYPDAS